MGPGMAKGCSRLLRFAEDSQNLRRGRSAFEASDGRPLRALSSRHVPRSHAPKAAQEASNNKEETLQEDQQQQAAEEAVVEAPIE